MDAVTAQPVDLSPAEETPPPIRAGWDLASIASFACGLLLIVPYFAGVAAISLALIGLHQINEHLTRGRRLALAGAALGLLNIVGWTIYFLIIARLSAPGRSLANHFVADLNAAHTDAAAQLCLSSISHDRLESAAHQVLNWGGAKHVTVLYITTQTANDATTGIIRGNIETPTGPHVFDLQTVENQIADFTFR